MRTRGQFSKPAPFNYQSHQSLQKFRKVPIEQRAQEVVQDIFKIKLKGDTTSKLIMAKNTPPSKQQEIKQLKKQIKLMENELKKKILDNPILSRIFKTKQPTNGQMAHLDLYLEFVKLKEEQQNNEKKNEQALEVHKQKQMTYELEISQLKDEMQKREQNFITQIEKASAKFEKLQKEFQKKILDKEKIFEQQTIQRESKIQDSNMLLEELKRKNHKLSKQNKDYEAKLNEYKKSQQDRIKSLKAEFESYKQKASEERASQQEEVQKIKKQLKTTENTLNNRISELENQLAEKTLQIQELDRFIELEKDSYETKMYEIQSSHQAQLRKIHEQSQQVLMNQKQSSESEIKKLIRSEEEKIKQLTAKYEKDIKALKDNTRKEEQKISQLSFSYQESQKAMKKLQQDIKKYSQQTEMQIQSLKTANNNLQEEKQVLSKKLTQSQAKSEKLTKQIQFLTHQKNEMHSKYQKGFMNSENDIKHYQTIVDELQRKIYMLGNQNVGLKKSLEQKTTTQNKVKQFNRISQETYQQKYKAIGRIEQIKHKLQNFMISDFTRGFSNNFNMSSNNYRSINSNHQSSVSLTDSIQGLTMALDKLCDHYSSQNQAIESFRKQKQEDQREIESILNHFLDMEERQDDLEEALINYINLRKELSKQQTANTGIYCGEEFLLQKKRQICQFVIEKLIQLKVIKQYSSADQGVSSYRVPKDHHQTKEIDYSSNQSSSKYFLSSINHGSNNSRRSLKNLVMEEQYRSNEDFVNNDECYDSLEMTKRNKPKIMQENVNLMKERKSIITKVREPSKPRGTMSSKSIHRMSTQPSKCQQDIEQQSTYQILDQNMDYSNMRRTNMSKPKCTNDKTQYNSSSMTATKEQLNKKYRDQIKEKLLSGKGKRDGAGLSKEDIEKKYFLR